MSRRLSFSQRRRRQLSLHIAESLDQRLEHRSTVTPIGAAALSITAAPAIGQLAGASVRDGSLAARTAPANGDGPLANGPTAAGGRSGLERGGWDLAGARRQVAPAGGGGGSAAQDGPAVAAPRVASQADGGDWLTLSPVSDQGGTGSGISTPWHPAKPAAGGAALPPRGGSGGGAPSATAAHGRGQVTPFRVPTPQSAAGSSGAANSAALLAAVASASQQGGIPAATIPFSPQAPTTSAAPPTNPGGRGSARAGLTPPADGTASPMAGSGGGLVSGGGTAPSSPTGAALPLFPYFNVYVLDVNDGVTLFPGVDQVGHAGVTVVLDAQVTGSSVASYNWDTSHITGLATGIAGSTTDQLTFAWDSTISSTSLTTITLSVTDTSSHVETFTYDFEVLQGSGAGGSGGGSGGGGGGGGGGSVTWPSTYSPDTVGMNATEWQSHGVSVNASSGALDTTIPLPGYNPNVPALALTYNSQAANPRPIIIAEHPLSTSSPTPTQVSATLTFNGTAGTTYYWSTSSFNPGDIQQIALQANAASLSTGRYSYSMQVVDHGTTLTTTTYSGTATVLNESSDPMGAGWSVQGLEQITSVTGGVILNLGTGGDSLWFASSGGSGGYTSPAGDFSTLVQDSGGGWTRTMTDGTVYTFNSSGYETVSTDRNGLHTTFSYNGSNQLSTVKDPYNNLTTFTYSGGDLHTIQDPASRLTTFTFSGGNLQAVEQADNSRATYTYASSGQLTQVKDPLGHVVSIVYDSAGRVGTITSPDLATEEFGAFQEQGWTNSGTSGSPATPMLFAAAAASYTNPNGNATSVMPDWSGLGTPGVVIDALGDIGTIDRNANGLAIDAIDPLNRIDQYAYDAQGNVTSHTFPDGSTESYGTYNSFAEPASFTNANVQTSYYTYDGHGNLTVVKDPLNNLTTLTYTGNGQVQTITDANNHVTSFQYDSQDRLTTLTNADGTTALFTYNTQGDVTASTDPRGNTTTYSYDALDRQTGTTDPLGNRTTDVYDSGGNLIQVQAPTPIGQTARTTAYAYDSMNRLTTVTDPLGYKTVYGYDADGNVVSVQDPMSRITTIAYDALDRPITVTDPMGGITTTTYDADGEALTVTDPMGRVTTTVYNSRGWVYTQTDPRGNTATYTYDNLGHVTEVGQPASSGGGGTSGGGSELTYYYYDGDGRLTQMTDPTGANTYYRYDGVGNMIGVTDPNSNITSYSYDSMNRLTTITDPLGHTTVLGYNADGQQTSVTDALGHTTTTLYDANGRATTLISAVGGTTTITYDAAGRETSLTDPVGNTTSWSYNADDEVTQQTDPNGATVTYIYNGDRELTDTTDQNGRRTTYSYNADGDNTGQTWLSGGTALNVITYSYDADNELTGAADSHATLTFTYDSGGNLTSAATSGPGTHQPSATLNYTNDPSGNVLHVTDNIGSGGGMTSYTYDPNERVTGVQTNYGGTAGPQIAVTYDSGGRITSESRTIGGSGTSVNTSYSYDAANRQTTITDQSVSGGTTTPIGTYVYSYDQANRVTTQVNAEGTYTYTYDIANQLTGVHKNGTSAESYSYDLNGNRTGTGYSTGTGNEQTASPGYTYTYDNAGNMIAETNTSTHVTTSYTYDFRNRLTEVTQGGTVVATYTYDALDRRIGIDDNGTQTWTVYDGKNPYADFNGSGALTERYVHGPGVVNGQAVDELLARTSAGGATAWYLTDKLGSVRDIVNSSGTVIDHIVYDGFGNITSQTQPANGDRFMYAGMEYDAVTGQYYDRARFYDPLTGRFEAQDPKGFAAGDANLYRYVGNGSTDATDPTGMDSGGQQASTLVGIGVGASTAYYLTAMAVAVPGAAPIVITAVVIGGIAGGIYGYFMGANANGLVAGAVSGIVAGLAGGVTGAALAPSTFWTLNAATGGLVTKALNGPGCFAAGTQVLMATETMAGERCPDEVGTQTWGQSLGETEPDQDGATAVAVLYETSRRTKNIEDVAIGDFVVARDVQTGALVAREVIQTSHHVSYYRRLISVVGSDGASQTLATTDAHPFWVEGQGWTQARNLLVDSHLLQLDSTIARVRSMAREYCPSGVHMYNLQVDNKHTYHVSQDCGRDFILVHNGPCDDYEQIKQETTQVLGRAVQYANQVAQSRANLQRMQANIETAKAAQSMLRKDIYDILIQQLQQQAANYARQLEIAELNWKTYWDSLVDASTRYN